MLCMICIGQIQPRRGMCYMSCRLYGFHPGNMTRSCRSRRVAVSTTAVAMNAVVQPASSLLVRCHRDTAKSSDDTNRVAQQRNELLYNNILSLLLLSSFWTSCGLRCRSSPPRYVPSVFLWRIGFSFPTARQLSSNVAIITHALSLSAGQFVHKKIRECDMAPK